MVPPTGKQTIHTRIHRTAVLASTVPYTQNMHDEKKIITICKNVLRMQHQCKAYAPDLGDGSHVTCL